MESVTDSKLRTFRGSRFLVFFALVPLAFAVALARCEGLAESADESGSLREERMTFDLPTSCDP